MDSQNDSQPTEPAGASAQTPTVSLGMIGLGRMGANILRRAMQAGIPGFAFDTSPVAVDALVADGATGANTLHAFIAAMPTPRTVWIMVPAGKITDVVVTEVLALLEPGDVLIDGGNSYYRDDIRHSAVALERGVSFIDVGTSGGVWGLERGYCLMIGGAAPAVERLRPIWDALAPGVETAPRTPGRTGDPDPEELGWLHCGPSGAGHFVKMVHNGIEYGLMAAYAEGMNILKHAGIGLVERQADAETAPLSDPQFYQYDIDIPAVAEVWRRGSVVGSWLLDLTALALRRSPELEEFGGRVSDSGEGRWTALAAIEEGVPAPVLTAALYERFASQGADLFANRILSAMRKEFGGHDEKTKVAPTS